MAAGAGTPGLTDANDTIGRMYVQMHEENERSMTGREILEPGTCSHRRPRRA